MPLRCPVHLDYTAAVSFMVNGRDGKYPVYASPGADCDGCLYVYKTRHALADGIVILPSKEGGV